eukprot:g8953.t1
MSNHRARPRSGEFSVQKIKDLQDRTRADVDPDSREVGIDQRSKAARSPARSYSAPYSQRSPAALVIDNANDSGGGRGSSSHGVRGPHEGRQQQHRRVVSLSWPGEARPVERTVDWDQQLQDISRRISSSSSSSSGSGGSSGNSSSSSSGGKAPAVAVAVADMTDRPGPSPGPATTFGAQLNVNDNNVDVDVKAAPNKRQRQMAFSKKRVSSGPIDIPPSPRASAANAPAGARGLRRAGGADSRGGRAATDAGEWYPCWSATRPDDKKCGEGGGPPEHILIWERAVRSASHVHAIGAEGEGGGRSARASRGSARGKVVGSDDSEGDEEDDLAMMRQERRLSSEDQGSGSIMLFEMDM